MDVDFLGIRLILLGFLIDQRVNGAVIHQTPKITMTTQAKLTTAHLHSANCVGQILFEICLT